MLHVAAYSVSDYFPVLLLAHTHTHTLTDLTISPFTVLSCFNFYEWDFLFCLQKWLWNVSVKRKKKLERKAKWRQMKEVNRQQTITKKH